LEGGTRVAGRGLDPAGLFAVLIGATLAAWAVLLVRMRGMDAGPGTDLGALWWYVGVWVTMTAAMMLPSASPMVLVYAKVAAGSSRRPVASTVVFLAGYVVAWIAYGLVAYGLYRLVRSLDPAFLGWSREGPIVAGAVIALAGLYQLTPMKQICLRHCRTPFHFVLHRWHAGALGALRMGVEHGLWCVGCCWALMLVLFAVGVMSLTWMVIVAAVIFAEKVLPVGERLTTAFALALVALGIWIAVAPGSVPFLTEPGGTMPMGGGMP
jgi:predicted metal-binding membrane protein